MDSRATSDGKNYVNGDGKETYNAVHSFCVSLLASMTAAAKFPLFVTFVDDVFPV